MRLNRRNTSKVSLTDILRRKKTTLTKFLAESGIVTYELLVSRCDSMGLVPPDENVFFEALGRKQTDAPVVSSPAEGVVVLDPPVLVSEKTGKPVTDYPDFSLESEDLKDSQVTDAVTQLDDTSSQKSQKKKRV